MLVANQEAQTLTKPSQFELQPTTFDQAMKYAEIIAKSNFVPKDYKDKPGDVLIAIQMGQEIGLKPLQALQNIASINGRPCVWGDAMLGLIKAQSVCEYVKETFDDTKAGGTAYCASKRKDQPEYVYSFSMEDAKKAGLSTKPGPWQLYPKRMLQMRARGFSLRDTFPDILKGIISREEAEDYPQEKFINPENNKVSVLKNMVASQETVVPETVALLDVASACAPPLDFEAYKTMLAKSKSTAEVIKIGLDIKNYFVGDEDDKIILRDLYSIRLDEFKGATE